MTAWVLIVWTMNSGVITVNNLATETACIELFDKLSQNTRQISRPKFHCYPYVRSEGVR